MTPRGTRGAYRKEDRAQLPLELQRELVEKAAARYGNCQELAKHLNIPKSSVHYYKIGRLTMPVSVLEQMLKIANDEELRERIESRGITKDRSWATEYAQDIYREICRDRVRLPTKEELLSDDGLRTKAAAIVSYVLAEGSVWLQKEKFGEHAVNITFAEHEEDIYEHFRSLCRDVFLYDIGPPQMPGNGARAIRGFIYSRFVAEWLVYNGIPVGDKSSKELHLPSWVMGSVDPGTWTAALQPWCDGEGCVALHGRHAAPSFSLAQSRHTNLNTEKLPRSVANPTYNGASIGAIRRIELFGESLVGYLEGNCRSEILDDLVVLFKRLGLSPKPAIRALILKADDYWSCVWELRFGTSDASKLLKLNLIRQQRKAEKLGKATDNNNDIII